MGTGGRAGVFSFGEPVNAGLMVIDGVRRLA